MIRVFQSPNICRDMPRTQEFKTLANKVREDFSNKMAETQKKFKLEKLVLTGIKANPTYKKMLELFCPDIFSMPLKYGESAKVYGLPVVEDEDVSSIAFEFKEEEV